MRRKAAGFTGPFTNALGDAMERRRRRVGKTT
jgi:hypothetical protein